MTPVLFAKLSNFWSIRGPGNLTQTNIIPTFSTVFFSWSKWQRMLFLLCRLLQSVHLPLLMKATATKLPACTSQFGGVLLSTTNKITRENVGSCFDVWYQEGCYYSRLDASQRILMSSVQALIYPKGGLLTHIAGIKSIPKSNKSAATIAHHTTGFVQAHIRKLEIKKSAGNTKQQQASNMSKTNQLKNTQNKDIFQPICPKQTNKNQKTIWFATPTQINTNKDMKQTKTSQLYTARLAKSPQIWMRLAILSRLGFLGTLLLLKPRKTNKILPKMPFSKAKK